ncbi:MAG: 16S rRNA (cytidine(1402)-2'-O)-methyltransferase, partial [Acidimicrobiales bacterium]
MTSAGSRKGGGAVDARGGGAAGGAVDAHGGGVADGAGDAGGGGTPSPGRIVLIATPIGNLGDLSPRAIQALADADLLACEDTRRTRALLTHCGITAKKLMALHEHNEVAQSQRVLGLARAGRQVGVVSDAGMPGISDPGQRLVQAAREEGIDVTVIPGPSAVLAGLVASGLPTDRFVFDGFLPRKGAARARALAELAGQPRTTVIFEAPHRIGTTLSDLGAACGAHRRVCVARELTKMFEEVFQGTLAQAIAWAAAKDPRGEFVLVLS